MLPGHETRTSGFALGDGSSLDHPRKQPSVDGYKNRTPGFVWVMATHSITPGCYHMLSGHETRTTGLVLDDDSSLDHPRKTTRCRPSHKTPGFVWVMSTHSTTPGNNMLSGHKNKTPGFV